MSRTVSVLIGLLLVAGVGAWVYSSRPNFSSSNTPSGGVAGGTSAPSESTNPNSSGGRTYTLAQIAGHNDSVSCWSAINGSVYDLTSWIPNHPGGPQRILSICGKDGSNAFNGQHGGDSRVASILFGFKIGTLAS